MQTILHVSLNKNEIERNNVMEKMPTDVYRKSFEQHQTIPYFQFLKLNIMKTLLSKYTENFTTKKMKTFG